jgi:glucans biosynthesis protein C
MDEQLKIERLYYLDWLRVVAVLLLIPYHTGMIFVNVDFHIKNNVTSTGLTLINGFVDNWHMPLFFLLAGASTWFALKKRPPIAYIKERLSRLIIPLIFGILIIVPPQTYYEKIQKSGFTGNYFDFYSQLLKGLYPMTWNHLWFLFYLFIISSSALPLILSWKSGKGTFFAENLGKWLAKGHRIFLLSVPLAIIQMTLKVEFPGPQNIVTDWARILFMLFIFLYGALFYIVPLVRDSLERNLWIAFFTGTAILAFYLTMYGLGYKIVFGYNLPNLIELGLESLATLCWLIVLLGLSQRLFNFSNSFLKYAAEAVLPVYILHQTIILIIGYHIVNYNLSLMVKYILINLISFIIIVTIYETIVRRIGLLRFLFGMRFKAK